MNRPQKWWEEYDIELYWALMLGVRLVEWGFYFLCAWYVNWSLSQ